MSALYHCGSKLCVYWDNWSCKNKEIRINKQGICMDYIPVKINEEELDIIRKESFSFYDKWMNNLDMNKK